MPQLVFTVTNELSFDQRMQRICYSLSKSGFDVCLVGRKMKDCPPLKDRGFKQVRLNCFFEKGFLFYLEYNFRLFIFLLLNKADCICAIDLDTIIPCYLASSLKGCKRVYDAHEFFTEQKEIVSRPQIYRFWLAIERWIVPAFQKGYTVNNWIAEALQKRYGVQYAIVRNMPFYYPLNKADKTEKFIIYQGAVNEGRCFETLIPAFSELDCSLRIYGKGNYLNQTKSIIYNNHLQHKIEVYPPLDPIQLRPITAQALVGITLFDNQALNQVHSLANRFFDYIMAGIPQICVDYPEYRALNETYHVALLIKDTDSKTIANALNKLLNDPVLYQELSLNCLNARKYLNWEQEEQELIRFYNTLFQ